MSIVSNKYLSMRSGLDEKQLFEAAHCRNCIGAYKKLFALGETIEESYYPDERIQKIADFTANAAIGVINQHHPYISDFLIVKSGLTHMQLSDANKCEKCKGCFKRLIAREKEVLQSPMHERADRIAVLQSSRAIGLIDEHHPFNMELITKHTRLANRDIEPINNCSNTDCKCKQIWAELKRLVETLEYERPGKDSVHELFILENIIQDPEELHGSTSDF